MVGKKIDRLLLLGLSAILCLSCADLFDTHPYALDFDGETNINSHQITNIEKNCLNKDTLRIVVTGDTQGWYDQTEEMVDDINRRGDVDFVIHGGDLSNYGATREFVLQRTILDRLDMPYVVIIGNHDCLGTGKELYQKMFGPTNFSFIVGRVKFVCLNTNALEYEDTDPIPNFDFLERALNSDTASFDRTVFCMHAPPNNEQFNNDLLPEFRRYVSLFPNVLFCTAAHLHYFECTDRLENGIPFFVSDCARHRNYILFTITPEGFSYEVDYY